MYNYESVLKGFNSKVLKTEKSFALAIFKVWHMDHVLFEKIYLNIFLEA